MKYTASAWNSRFLPPDELWERPCSTKRMAWEVCCYSFEEKGYLQHVLSELAVKIEALANNEDRILLTLPLNKTAIVSDSVETFKLVGTWKWWKSQTRNTVFGREHLSRSSIHLSAFPDDALIRIKTKEIKNTEGFLLTASFTIFQTYVWYRWRGNPAPYFGITLQTILTFIIIDECHRGTNDEGNWRGF
jgi:hypothetical protein